MGIFKMKDKKEKWDDAGSNPSSQASHLEIIKKLFLNTSSLNIEKESHQSNRKGQTQ
jgi:hypothetical protein